MKKLFQRDSWKKIDLDKKKVYKITCAISMLFLIAFGIIEYIAPSNISGGFYIKECSVGLSILQIIYFVALFFILLPFIMSMLIFTCSNNSSKEECYGQRRYKSVGSAIVSMVVVVVIIPILITTFVYKANIITSKVITKEIVQNEISKTEEKLSNINTIDDLYEIADNVNIENENVSAHIYVESEKLTYYADIMCKFDIANRSLVDKKINYRGFNFSYIFVYSAITLLTLILYLLYFATTMNFKKYNREKNAN